MLSIWSGPKFCRVGMGCKNIEVKGGNAGYQYLLLFPQCYLSFRDQSHHLINIWLFTTYSTFNDCQGKRKSEKIVRDGENAGNQNVRLVKIEGICR